MSSVNKVITETAIYNKKLINDALNEETAKYMGFKKVHMFMGKLCIQKEGDVPNNNIPWAPSTNAEQAFEILNKYMFTLSYSFVGAGWMCFSEHACDAIETDPKIAICKCLVAHGKQG